jgi:glycerol-3-phosphate cytidylyltransferase
MNKKELSIGYTMGVFDLFHIGHVNLLRNAKSLCDKLIVGVTIDELVKYKNKNPIIPYEQRVEVVKACRYVDAVIPQNNMDKFEAWKKLKFDVLFVGDDWFGKEKWEKAEEQLKEVGVKIIYFPYTKNISSTLITQFIEEKKGLDEFHS